MFTRSRARRRSDRGAAAVEFALILPVLLVLVLGIVEFGRAYYYQTTVSGAAREGVRVMALKNNVAQATTTTTTDLANFGVTGAAVSIKVTDPAGVSVSPVSCTSGRDATVTVTYPMSYITGFFGNTLTLHGKGTMRCGG